MKTHLQSKTRLYRTWNKIKERCYHPHGDSGKYYKDKGITMCDIWHKFVPFMTWAKENGYKDNLQIDRIDSNGNYEPSNCRFVTPAENSQNRSTTKLTKYDVMAIRTLRKIGSLRYKEIANIFNVSVHTITAVMQKRTWRTL